MRVKIFIGLIFLIIAFGLNAQSLNSGNFARHLYQQQLYTDLFYISDNVMLAFNDTVYLYASLAAIQSDSINRLQNLLNKANPSPNKEVLRLYYDSKVKTPIKYDTTISYETPVEELNYWMKSQHVLLMRDTILYRKFQKEQPNNKWFLENFQTTEKSILMISELKNKNPWVAGTLSAVMPGLGKAYNGKPLQGLSALMICASLGYQTYEAYQNRKASIAPLYVFGSLMGAFYVGNIYGSAIGVTVSKNRLNAEIDNQILFTMRRSLHSFYR